MKRLKRPKCRKGLPALILACGIAHGNPFFWNPQSAGDGDMAVSGNWTSNPDGTGTSPESDRDDDFADTSIGPWILVDSVRDGMTRYSFDRNPGKLTLTSRGFDYWTDANYSNTKFAGLFRSDIQGDFDVRVRIDTQTTDVYNWTKSGIMAVNNPDKLNEGGAAYVAVTPREGIGFYSDTGGTIGTVDKYWGNNRNGLSTPFPVWLRLVKSAGTFSGFYRHSPSEAWIQVGLPIRPQGPVANSRIGLFNISHDSTKSDTVVFDDFAGGGILRSQSLDLRFSGTGPANGVNAYLSRDLQAGSIDFGNYPGVFSFLASRLSVTGHAVFSQSMKVLPGTGSLAFPGAMAPSLSPPPATEVLPHILKSGPGTLTLSGPLKGMKYTQTAGSLDLNGKDISLAGNLSIAGDSVSILNLGGRTITVGGDARLSGSAASPLKLNPASAWTIKVAGSLTADHALIANSHATGSRGSPSPACVDGQGNVNWEFPPPACDSGIEVSPDTTVDEGQAYHLRAAVGCGASFEWSVVSGPGPRILDPAAGILVFAAPRITRDTVIVFRLTAQFGSGAVSRDIQVKVKEAIADPTSLRAGRVNYRGPVEFRAGRSGCRETGGFRIYSLSGQVLRPAP